MGADGTAPTAEEVAAALLADEDAVAMLMGADGTAPTAEEVAAALLADEDAVAMLKGDPGDPGMDGAAGAAGADVSLAQIWEAIAGDAIEAHLLMGVGTTGAVSVTELKAAITATAMKYGLSDTSALAYVDENYPQFETLRRAEVTTALAGLHAAGTLAATRDAVAEVLMGATGAAGAPGAAGTPAMDADPDEVLAMAWESIAGEAIEDDLETRINAAATKTGPVTHKQLSDAIKATAKAYGISPTAALAMLNTENPNFARLLRTRADAIVAAIHAADHLAATEDSAITVIAAKAATEVDSLPGAPARSEPGRVARAAEEVAKKIQAELAKGVLSASRVATVVEDIVTMYDGSMTYAELTTVIDAATEAAAAARGPCRDRQNHRRCRRGSAFHGVRYCGERQSAA